MALWSALVLGVIALGILAAGFLIGRYYVPDNRALETQARSGKSYVQALGHLAARDIDAAIDELLELLRNENVEDLEPYFALGALFRGRGEWTRAIRVHQTLSIRDKKQRLRTLYELGLDYRAAGMPKLASRVMEQCLEHDSRHEGAVIALCHIYEEQGRYAEAADAWRKLHKLRGGDAPDSERERRHHLMVAAAQRAADHSDWDTAKRLLREVRKSDESSVHAEVAAAEMAMGRNSPKGAIAGLERALALAPEYARFLMPGLVAAQRELEQARLAKERARERAKKRDSNQERGQDPGADESSELDEGAARRVVDVLSRVLQNIGRNGHIEMALAEMRSFYDPVQALDDYRRVADEFPEFLPARVAAARLALASGDAQDIQDELYALASADGCLSWAMEGSWRCGVCGKRDDDFFWRCRHCRSWGSARLDVGRDVLDVPPPPPVVHEVPRGSVGRALLGAAAERALPEPALESGMSEEQLHEVSRRPSVFGRVGNWFSSLRKSKDSEPAQSSTSALPDDANSGREPLGLPAAGSDAPVPAPDGETDHETGSDIGKTSEQ